ncbi:hypothetical protein [Fibrivirga algicola]|uniref:Outer membrane protein beta-barrel domain-containing protein n=1 Tax=Fibrivirga algicola TaxID=2950420 RepID=A0ABX0QFW6_9BACT|nr:hypothetical protein [Fibrivirga algicola]ARK12053.1 hypothetical protein A6C57_17905 [Fibrella sp. ES10-3-2-2]NID11119.1 hypothetical protein [Fibrivirga algicola]
MKRTSLLFLMMLTASMAMAQKAFIFNTLQKNGFISISAGISQPMGTFGKLTGEQSSGMAIRGQVMSVSGGYRMAGPLGLMARYEQTANGIDPTAMLGRYSQLPGDQLTVAPATGRAGQWQTRSIMLGPYVTIPVGRVSLDIHALAGQIWATCPETCIQGKLNQQATIIRADNQESKTISAGIGLTARYRLTPAIALHMNGDYSSSSFTFADVPLESTVGAVAKQTTFTSSKTLSMATVSLGLTIQFRARNYVF